VLEEHSNQNQHKIIKYARLAQQRVLAEKIDLIERLGGVLGRHVDRLKKAREKEFEKELEALTAEVESDNEHLHALQQLLSTEVTLEPWIRDSVVLQVLKTKFAR